ncbi:hypothetical protein L218DRAFT_958408 [Marasmius fiardii PR-910]|nr:hypothetical protein L218DRAFT_958408 [Marasmius fiardii PR-910]
MEASRRLRPKLTWGMDCLLLVTGSQEPTRDGGLNIRRIYSLDSKSLDSSSRRTLQGRWLSRCSSLIGTLSFYPASQTKPLDSLSPDPSSWFSPHSSTCRLPVHQLSYRTLYTPINSRSSKQTPTQSIAHT